MVILVSNIVTDHCHHEKKLSTVISSALASVFASPPAFFHFALVFFSAGLANP